MRLERRYFIRSISFDLDLADVWDADRSAVPSRDNSQWVEALLEERFYGQKMRPISEAAQRELKQIAAGRAEAERVADAAPVVAQAVGESHGSFSALTRRRWSSRSARAFQATCAK